MSMLLTKNRYCYFNYLVIHLVEIFGDEVGT
jgi:hypothetical protein